MQNYMQQKEEDGLSLFHIDWYHWTFTVLACQNESSSRKGPFLG